MASHLHPDADAVLAQVPDRGRLRAILYFLGLKRHTRLWGGRFVARSRSMDLFLGWHLMNGRWESQDVALGLRHIDFSLPLLELGGGLGVTACIFNRHLADPERHVVVEMDAVSRRLIEQNRRLNSARFRVVAAAIGHDSGPRWGARRTRLFEATNRLADAGQELDVPVRSLQSVADEAGFDRFNLVMDIEGGEEQVIRNEGRLLQERVASVVFELHPGFLTGPQSFAVVDRLRELGFEAVDWRSSTMAFINRRLVPKRDAPPEPSGRRTKSQTAARIAA